MHPIASSTRTVRGGLPTGLAVAAVAGAGLLAAGVLLSRSSMVDLYEKEVRDAIARVTWLDFQLKTAHGKPFTPLSCRQSNAAQEPTLIAFMGGRMAKVIPFEGRDKYQDGRGHMLVKVGGLFSAVDEKGATMDQSGLVTVLAEAFLLPSYVLQPYIQQGNDAGTIPWSGLPAEYVEKDGIRFPGGLSAVWHERDGDFEYVRGRIERIDYDVKEP